MNLKSLLVILALIAASLVPLTASASSPTVCLRHTATITSYSDHARIEGTAGRDVVIVYGAHATVNLNGGDDVACVYGEHATVNAGTGNDTVKVYDAHSKLDGGPGNDTLAILVAHDKLDGGTGIDKCSATQNKNHVSNCERFTQLTDAGSVP